MAWFSAGILVNPVIDTILADTGPMPTAAGPINIQVIFGGNIAAVAVVELRNAANIANVSSQVIACVANQAIQFDFDGLIFAASERLRVRLNAAVVGSVQASILT